MAVFSSPRHNSPKALPNHRLKQQPYSTPNTLQFVATSDSGAPVARTTMTGIATLPPGTKSGDLVIWAAQVSQTFTGTISASTSNTNGITKQGQGAQSTDQWVMALFYEISDGVNTPTFTWDGTSHNSACMGVTYRNFDPTTPLDATNTWQTTAVFQKDGGIGANPMPLPARQDTLMIGFGSNVNTVSTDLQSPNWIKRLDNNVFFIAEQPLHLATIIGRPIVRRSADSRDVSILTYWNPPPPSVSTGPNNFTSTQSGGVSFAGAPQFLTGKIVNGALSFTGTVIRLLARATNGALSFTGNNIRKSNKQTSGSLSFTGSVIGAARKVTSGSLSFTGNTIKRLSKSITGALSFTGSFIGSHVSNTVISASLSFTGSTPIKRIGKVASGALSFTGLDNESVRKLTSGASLSFTGTKLNSITHALSGALSFAGSALKSVSHALSGALSFTGNIATAAVHHFTQSLSGVLSFTGAQTRRTAHLISGGLSFTGSQIKSFAHALTGALSFSGSVIKRSIKSLSGGVLSFTGSISRAIRHALSGVLSFTGNLGTATAGHFSQALSGVLSFTGTQNRSIRHLLTGALSFTGTTIKKYPRAFAGVLSFTGANVRRALKVNIGALSFTGSITRRLAKVISGALSFNPPYSTMVLKDSPVNYWRLDDSGSTVVDTMGVRNGTTVGTVTESQPSLIIENNNSMTFNGTNASIDLGTGNLVSGNLISLECWISSTSSASSSIFDARTMVGGQHAGVNLFYAAGIISFWVGAGGVGVNDNATDTIAINDGKPHHIVGTYDGTTINIYRDGQLVGTKALSVTLGFGATPAARIASDFINRRYTGSIDEVSVYNTVLTPSQITAHYQAGAVKHLLVSVRKSLSAAAINFVGTLTKARLAFKRLTASLSFNAPYRAAVLNDVPNAYYRLGEASIPSPFASDSFTDTAGTTLQAHSGWTKHSSSTADALISTTGTLYGGVGASDVALYTINNSPTTGNYDVACDVVVVTDNNSAGSGPVARWDATATTGYHARWNSNGNLWQIVRFVNGTGTILAQVSDTFTGTKSAILQVRDGWQALIVNGATICTSTDATITSIGAAGIRIFGTTGDAVGVQLDNFSATNSSVIDETGNGHHGIYVNSPSLNQAGALAEVNTAASFAAASTQYALLDNLGNFGANLLNSSTEFWIKTTTSSTLVNCLGTANTGTTTSYAVYLNSVHSGTTTVAASVGKTAFFFRGQGAGNNNLIGDISTNIYDGNWHHVVWVVSATNAFQVYVDGVSQTVTMNTQTTVAGGNFGFGMILGASNNRGVVANLADCSLDEVAFYPTRLTATQVSNHYQAAFVRNFTKLPKKIFSGILQPIGDFIKSLVKRVPSICEPTYAVIDQNQTYLLTDQLSSIISLAEGNETAVVAENDDVLAVVASNGVQTNVLEGNEHAIVAEQTNTATIFECIL